MTFLGGEKRKQRPVEISGWEGTEDGGGFRLSGSFAALRMTARTNGEHDDSKGEMVGIEKQISFTPTSKLAGDPDSPLRCSR